MSCVQRRPLPLIALLRLRREQQGISQEDLEERIGVTRGLVQKWETATRMPSAYLLLCWAEALGLHIELAEPASQASGPGPAMAVCSLPVRSGTATRNC